MNNPLKNKSTGVKLLVLIGAILVVVPTAVLAVSWVYGPTVERQGTSTFEVAFTDITPTDGIDTDTEVTLTGTLTRNTVPISGATVFIDLLTGIDGTLITNIGSTTTNMSGDFVFVWTCDRDDATYYFRPRYDKDTY